MRSLLAAMPVLFAFALGLGCNDGKTKITGVEPNTGAFTGGEEIAILGQNLPKGGAAVRFGDKTASPVVRESDTKLRVTTPVGDKNTNVDISVIFDDGSAYQLKAAFRYLDNQQQSARDKFFKK